MNNLDRILKDISDTLEQISEEIDTKQREKDTEGMQTAWENFKKVNEDRIKNLEKKQEAPEVFGKMMAGLLTHGGNNIYVSFVETDTGGGFIFTDEEGNEAINERFAEDKNKFDELKCKIIDKISAMQDAEMQLKRISHRLFEDIENGEDRMSKKTLKDVIDRIIFDLSEEGNEI